jgi:uncharacterized protein (DUF2126 family)
VQRQKVIRGPSSEGVSIGQAQNAQPDPSDTRGETHADGSPVVRTALSVEARDSVVSVFLPPLARVTTTDLVAAIETRRRAEDARAHRSAPPPFDPRLLTSK